MLLELQKLPRLANTDLSSPNPNIQVRAPEGRGPNGPLERSGAEWLSSEVWHPSLYSLEVGGPVWDLPSLWNSGGRTCSSIFKLQTVSNLCGS